MNSKTRCLVCGHFLTTEYYQDGDPRICNKCWRCPQCEIGAIAADGNHHGVIVDGENTVICHPCDMAWSFKRFENALVKKANLVTCPTCKGKGTVAGEKKENPD